MDVRCTADGLNDVSAVTAPESFLKNSHMDAPPLINHLHARLTCVVHTHLHVMFNIISRCRPVWTPFLSGTAVYNGVLVRVEPFAD